MAKVVKFLISRYFFLSIVLKAVIEVNEQGSEAAAATAVKVVKRSLPVIHPFHADRPFLYFIVDNRVDAILFAGHVINPIEQLQTGSGTSAMDSTQQNKQEL